jgi:hypothetical protein
MVDAWDVGMIDPDLTKDIKYPSPSSLPFFKSIHDKPTSYPNIHAKLEARESIRKGKDPRFGPADYEQFRQLNTTGYSLNDALYLFDNTTTFYDMMSKLPGYSEAFDSPKLNVTIFVPVDMTIIKQDDWDSLFDSPTHRDILSTVLSYHVATDGMLDLGRIPQEKNIALRSNVYVATDKPPLPLIVYQNKERITVNCATIIRGPFMFSNAAMYIINQPLDPWIEGQAGSIHLRNGTRFDCEQLLASSRPKSTN